MTIGQTEPVNIVYGNNLATKFDYDFYIETEEQLVVEHTNFSGVTTVLTYGVDYSIDGIGNEDGGQINFPLQGSTYQTLGWNESTDEKEMLVISLSLPFEQAAEFDISGDLNKKNLEKALDYQMRCTQILNRKVGRAILVQEGADSKPEELIASIEEAKLTSQSFAQVAMQKANEANASAISAGEEATIATQLAAEVAATHEQALSDIEDAKLTAKQEMHNLKENSIAEIKAVGIWMEDDRLFYRDEDNIIHEFRNDFGGIPPMAVKHKEVKKTDDGFVLTWSDPDDSTYQNNVYCTWGNTLIIRKEGSYPASPFDGAIVVNNTVRNKYATNGYLDEVDTTKDWYYRAFPCSINKVYNLDDFNKFGLWVYSFTRLKNESVPSEKIVYRGTNKYYQKAYNDYTAGKVKLCDWENAPFLLKDRLAPCAVNFDGELEYFLDRNDFTKKEDGTASNNSDTTTDLNFYIRIKLLYRRLKKNANGDTEVDISNKQVNNEYKPYGCFIKPDGTLREYIYFPIYKGSFIDGKVRSIAGQTPMSGKTAEQERAGCQANGTGHDMVTIAELDLMRDLYMLMFADTDSQTALGQGKSNGGENVGACLKSGTMDKKGMFSGSTSTAEGVKFCGAENPYSSQWTRYLGEVLVNGVRKVKLCQGTSDGSTVSDFNFTGEGYIALTELPTITGTSSGFISQSETVDDIGTFPVVVSGSSTTNECDKMWFNNSGTMVALRGGDSYDGVGCGFFCSGLNDPASSANWLIGSSVSYKPL